MCPIEEPNQRRLMTHGRTVHGSTNAIKRSIPTEYQKHRLIEIKGMLTSKGIDVDFRVYGIE